MRIDILTLFPGMFQGPFDFSIIRRAADKGFLDLQLHDLRDYTSDKYRTVDDYPYGGGAGMVMMIEPIFRCIRELQSKRKYDEVIFLTPDGELLDQRIANYYSMKNNIILLCGHYKGVDERVREHLVTREISIGNYVLSGGELAAAVVVDSIARVMPGVLGDETSALSDSFQDDMLSPPVYTRPADFMGWKVPEILLSGHEKKIREWRLNQALERTKHRRPGLMDNSHDAG